MDNNYPPLSEKVAKKLIADFKAGTSIFQNPVKEDGKAAFALPYNPATDKNYRGHVALILMMQGREDARWMSFDKASYNKTPVRKEEKGTWINFYASSEIQPLLNDKGEKELKENGKPKTHRVKLDEPVLKEYALFNGEQLNNLREWKQVQEEKNALQPLSPIERAQNIIDASKVSLAENSNAVYYDRETDSIEVPDKDLFESPEKYYNAVLHEMTRWATQDGRLNEPMGAEAGSDNYFREELRTNIASLLIGTELNLGYEMSNEEELISNWSAMLKEDPSELFEAASDAQVIADYVLAFEKKVELKQEIDQAIPVRDKLSKGDVIPYNDMEYKVLSELKNNVFQMQESTGRKFKVGANDVLYNKLLDALNNPVEKTIAAAMEIEEPVLAEEKNDYITER